MPREASRVVAVGAVALGAALGVAAVAVPATALPLALELLVLLGATIVVVRREADPASRRWLTGLVAAGLSLRLVLAIAIHFRFSAHVLAPDASTYEFYGRAIRDFWLGERDNVGRIGGSWQTAYYWINGAFVYLFGEGPLGPVVLNIFLSLWTGIVTYRLGFRLVDARAARIASALVVFFPSLVLWSVLNIRDAASTFLVVSVVHAAVEGRRRGSLGVAAAVLAGLVVLSAFRDYMGFLVGAGLLLGLLLAVRPERVYGTLLAGVPIAVLLVFGAELVGLLERFPATAPMETLSDLRLDLTARAGSAFARETVYETPGQALRYLPRGMSYFLFAPFPWAVRSPLQMAALPETLLWYALVPATVAGVRRGFREARTGILLPFAVIVLVLVSYSLVEGNVGTAYRHRAQLMPLLFLFTAVGLSRWRRPVVAREEDLGGSGRTPPVGVGGT